METFTAEKDLVQNPDYQKQRDESLRALDLSKIDAPIIELIRGFNEIPHCFTLQCCYGHFVYPGQNDPHNLAPLPVTDKLTTIEYRIAYIAFCVKNCHLGQLLLDDMTAIAATNSGYIQFGCANWFWEQQLNSYAIQLEPENQMFGDTATVSYEEALLIHKIRGEFFTRLERMMQKHKRLSEN